ncbi:MAG: hypothetical protein QNJ07_05315 [Woeseiaceae bacterium]|nr:hypothetical protein [Woeseiaceae bacterium]
MTRTKHWNALAAGVVALFLALPVCAASVNKSIKVSPGSESDGETSVNGSITIGAGAVVTGAVKTVNGSISIDDDAKVEKASTVNGSVRIGDRVTSRSLSTVNGTIRMGQNCEVDGHIETVNGRIAMKSGSSVMDDVENVNGDFEIVASTIGGDLSTVNGDVLLDDGAVLKGDLIVEKPSGWGWGKKEKKRKPRIVIGPGSRVEGVIDLEREVELFISESAEVGDVRGELTMADAVRFSGKRP